MAARVVLLRGVNVGGAGTRLPMAAFREVLVALGCHDVATYIQSGNAVVRSDLAAADLAVAIRAAITLPNGTHPAAFVLAADAVTQALAANPFPQAEAAPKSLHLMFLEREPVLDPAGLRTLAAADEDFALIGRVFYLYAPTGIGRSKMAAGMGRFLRDGGEMTARNLATMRALAGMIAAMPEH